MSTEEHKRQDLCKQSKHASLMDWCIKLLAKTLRI